LENLVIGVDGGGSKTHAVLLNQNGEIIDESFSSSANIRTNVDLAYLSITAVIEKLVKQYQIPLQLLEIGVGVAGYSVTANLHILQRRLEAKYPQVKLQSDCHIACLAAHHGQDGAILICGTGVVGYVIKNGTVQQIGGWGFPHGDLGGGAWLGLEVCQLVCKAADQVIPWSELLKAVYRKFNQNYAEYKLWLLNATPGDFADIARYIPDFMTTDVNARRIFARGMREIKRYLTILQRQGLTLKLVGGLAQFYLGPLIEGFPDLTISDTAPALGATYL